MPTIHEGKLCPRCKRGFMRTKAIGRMWSTLQCDQQQCGYEVIGPVQTVQEAHDAK